MEEEIEIKNNFLLGLIYVMYMFIILIVLIILEFILLFNF